MYLSYIIGYKTFPRRYKCLFDRLEFGNQVCLLILVSFLAPGSRSVKYVRIRIHDIFI